MSSWERILNLYFLLVELCCGAVVIALLIEMGMRWAHRSKKSRKSSTYTYHLVDGQRYYDSKHNVWYKYENGKWIEEDE